MKYIYDPSTDSFQANVTKFFKMNCAEINKLSGLSNEEEITYLKEKYGKCILDIHKSNFFKFCF